MLVRFIVAIIIGVLSIGYLLPWAIAIGRDHQHQWGIGFLNLFLGWTIIGWVVALVWGMGQVRQRV